MGAAFAVNHQIFGRPREFVMDHAGWGPQFSPQEIRGGGGQSGVQRATIWKSRQTGGSRAAASYRASTSPREKSLGWFQGRVEWGPRALGHRSILADPRRPEMKDILNRRIKHREIFRPFAPSIMEEATGEFFENSTRRRS